MTGAYFAAVGLLMVAGLAKLWRPHNTAVVLRVSDGLVRIGAAAEVVVGAAALTGNAVAAALMAASYAGFAAFVAVSLRKGSPISSCGCFGEPDTPPTALHVLLNLAAVTTLVGRANLASVVAHQPLGGVPFLALTAVVGYLAYLVMAVAPKVTR